MPRANRVGETLLKVSTFFLWVVPGFAQLAPNRFTLLLDDPPVAERFARREEMQSVAGNAYRARIEARQRTVMTELAARRIQVTGSTATLVNAIFVTAPAGRISEMLAIPGVAGVRPMHRFKPNLNAATQLMNAPAAWNTVGGQSNAGKGIKLSLIHI